MREREEVQILLPKAMSADEKQWRLLAIQALQFIGQLAKDCPAVQAKCERFAASAIGEHCGPLLPKATQPH